MTDIFSEVEEEIRKDRYNTLLRRYGPWILGAVIIIFAGVSLYELWWKPSRFEQVAEASNTYDQAIAALQQDSPALAEGFLDQLIEGDHQGYRALALMHEASIAARDGDSARAAALYEQAASVAGGGAFQDLARIRALYAVADDLSYSELIDRAQPLVEDSAFRFSARELIAAGALKEGDLERARREYNFLTQAPSTPQGVRRRAQEGLAAVNRAGLAAGASAPAEDTVAEEAPRP